jgi:hypothetical protein
MIDLFIKTEATKEAEDFFKATIERSLSESIATNPFYSEITYRKGQYNLYAKINMRCLYPDFSLLGVVFLLAYYVFYGWGYVMLIPFLISLTHVIHTNTFYYLMIRLGLRKAGYKGKIKWLKIKYLNC